MNMQHLLWSYRKSRAIVSHRHEITNPFLEHLPSLAGRPPLLGGQHLRPLNAFNSKTFVPPTISTNSEGELSVEVQVLRYR